MKTTSTLAQQIEQAQKTFKSWDTSIQSSVQLEGGGGVFSYPQAGRSSQESNNTSQNAEVSGLT